VDYSRSDPRRKIVGFQKIFPDWRTKNAGAAQIVAPKVSRARSDSRHMGMLRACPKV
jgi:hypothetical protein